MEPKIVDQAYKGKFRIQNETISAYLFDAKSSPTAYSNAFIMFEDLEKRVHILAGPKEIDEIIRVFEEGTLENVSKEELQTTYKNMLNKFIDEHDLDLDEPITSSTTLEDLTIQAIIKRNSKTPKR